MNDLDQIAHAAHADILSIRLTRLPHVRQGSSAAAPVRGGQVHVIRGS